MKYIIQSSLYNVYHQERLIDALDRLELEYELVEYYNFCENYDSKLVDGNTMVFGGTFMAKAAIKYNLTPGIFYNANHDYSVYSKHYGENMLNHDGIIMKISDPLPENYVMFFGRPTDDSKAFNGQVYMDHSWNEFVQDNLNNDRGRNITKDTSVLIAPLKQTLAEYRFFAIKGKVITGSRYRMGNRVIYSDVVDDIFYEFAQKMVDIYQPSDAFVIDLADTEKGIKVIEINCLNCSGFYHIDMIKLITSLEENFN